MANICEEKTKDYGVNLVMCDKFVENWCNKAQKNTRSLDIVYDEEEPVGFYTIDFDTNELSNYDEDLDELENIEENEKNSAEMKGIKRFKKELKGEKIWNDNFYTS